MHRGNGRNCAEALRRSTLMLTDAPTRARRRGTGSHRRRGHAVAR